MYAVIKTGGKQYRVEEKAVLRIEKLDAAAGDTVTIGEVLMVGGDTVRIGAPFVDGATVTARVLRQGLGRKIDGFTFKRRKNQHRRYGHRQPFTEVVIESIAA
jgi:large subunit ribosomal protein L21